MVIWPNSLSKVVGFWDGVIRLSARDAPQGQATSPRRGRAFVSPRGRRRSLAFTY